MLEPGTENEIEYDVDDVVSPCSTPAAIRFAQAIYEIAAQLKKPKLTQAEKNALSLLR